jgi:hypothetical protein
MFDLVSGAFDPETLTVLSAALDRAWDFVQADAAFATSDPSQLRSALATSIFAVARQGERNVVRLANGAISRLRHNRHPGPAHKTAPR